MFLRVNRGRPRKDGVQVNYVQLCHNEWDTENSRSQTRVLYNFGAEHELDLKALRRLVKSISRFLPGDEALRMAQAVEGSEQDPSTPIEIRRSRPLGGAWFLAKLWKKLGIQDAIRKTLDGRLFRTPVDDALLAMVANRCLAPSSKLAVEGWVRDEVALPGVSELPVQQLYRAMDALLEMQEEIQREVFFAVAHLLNLEIDLVLFDTTSTYFEVEDPDDEEGLRRYGHSKDHRPDRPQAVIGLAVTREGIPVRCWVWPGNTSDVSVVQEVKGDLVGWKLGRVVSVMDRGMVSEDNLRYLQRVGGHYIVGERMQSGKGGASEALSRPGRYKKVRDNLEVKEVVVGDGAARERHILVRNPQQAERDRVHRNKIVARLEAELEALGSLEAKAHSKAVCRLVAHKTYGKYLKQLKSGALRLDHRRLSNEAKLDGKYLLRVSDDTLSAEDTALAYKQLLEVEDSFRTLKQQLELRPVYHRLEDRIRAHVLLCWLALLMIRVAEVKTGQTWRKLRATLEQMHLVEFDTPEGFVAQRTELSRDQRGILKALDVPEPARFLDFPAPKHPHAA